MAYEDLIKRRRATIERGLDLRSFLNQRRRTLEGMQSQGLEPVNEVIAPVEETFVGTAPKVFEGDGRIRARSYEGKLEADDIMGTEAKLGRSLKGSVIGLPGTVYEFGRNVLSGEPEVEDIGRVASIGVTAKVAGEASKAGMPSADIAKSLVTPNPLSAAANLFTTALLSELGLDVGKVSSLGRMAGGIGGAFAGGPAGAFAGAAAGSTIGSAVSDFFDVRENEPTREAVETLHGAGGYRALTNPIDYIRAQRAYNRWSRTGVFQDPGYFDIDTDYDPRETISEFESDFDRELEAPSGSIFEQPETIFDPDPFDLGEELGGDDPSSDVGGFTDPGGGFSGWS
jgi:hypothetical protein